MELLPYTPPYTEGTTSTSVTPQPMAPFNTYELQNTAATLTKTAKDLREQLQLIRKLQVNMVTIIRFLFI